MESLQTTRENQPTAASRNSSSEYEYVLSTAELPYPQLIPCTKGESNNESSDIKETAVVSVKYSYVEPKGQITLLHDLQNPTLKDKLNNPPTYQERGGIESSDDSSFTKETIDSTVDCSGYEPKRWKVPYHYPQRPSFKYPLNKYPYDRGQKVVYKVREQHVTMFRGKYSGLYRQFVMGIRDSIYFKVVFYIHHQALSIIALCLGVKYLKECIGTFEMLFWVLIVMGLAGVVSFLFRMVSIVITKFKAEFKSVVIDFLADTFLVLFAAMAAAEMIILAATEKTLSCRTFVYYMTSINFGIFLIFTLTLLVYIDVLLDAFDPLNPRSLLRPILGQFIS